MKIYKGEPRRMPSYSRVMYHQNRPRTRKSLSVRLLGFDNRKAQGEFVEHPYQLAELAGVSFHRDLAGHDGVREGLLLEQDRIEGRARECDTGIRLGGELAGEVREGRVLQVH